jgi:ribosomal protein L9
MPKQTKKQKKKKEEETEEKEKKAEEDETAEAIHKTSIQISTKVRDRLWKLKFRSTYDEFLWEMCEIYEKQNEGQ